MTICKLFVVAKAWYGRAPCSYNKQRASRTAARAADRSDRPGHFGQYVAIVWYTVTVACCTRRIGHYGIHQPP